MFRYSKQSKSYILLTDNGGDERLRGRGAGLKGLDPTEAVRSIGLLASANQGARQPFYSVWISINI
jgi:hypothetical protein